MSPYSRRPHIMPCYATSGLRQIRLFFFLLNFTSLVLLLTVLGQDKIKFIIIGRFVCSGIFKCRSKENVVGELSI